MASAIQPQDTIKDMAITHYDEDNESGYKNEYVDLDNKSSSFQGHIQLVQSGRENSDDLNSSYTKPSIAKSNLMNNTKVTGSKRAMSVSSGLGSAKAAPNKLVRTDPSLVKINSFFTKSNNIKYNDATIDSAKPNPSESSHNSYQNNNSNPNESEPLSIFDQKGFIRQHSPGGIVDQTGDDKPFSFVCKKGNNNSKRDSIGFLESCSCCSNSSSKKGADEVTTASFNEVASTPISYNKLMIAFDETQCEYASIKNLLADIYNARSANIEDVLKNHTFVGAVSSSQSLIQYGTKLYLVHHSLLARSLFYQLVIRRFAVVPTLTLTEPVEIEQFVLAAVECLQSVSLWSPEDGEKTSIAAGAAKLLAAKAAMLEDYFGIRIESQDGHVMLLSLPALLEVQKSKCMYHSSYCTFLFVLFTK